MTVLDDITHGIAVVFQAAIGVVFLLAGLAIVGVEFWRPPTHSGHVYLGVTLAVFGAAIMPSIGPAVVTAIKAIVDALVKLLPFRTQGNQQPPAP